MVRLLVLCRAPYHLPLAEAEDWLRQTIEQVLARDELKAGRLTKLTSPSRHSRREWDWLIELRLEGLPGGALGRGSACCELLADLRMLGMAPEAVLAEANRATELRPR